MRDEVPEFDPQHAQARWVAYFDLLGITDRIRAGDDLGVFEAYQQAIERLEAQGSRSASVHTTWFSDTFLLATDDDSGPSFTQIESVARWFLFFMLQARIPLRGAIACGPMYADFRKRVFFGQAMVEAYEYGESQDWIGLVLCPSAEAAMKNLDLSLDDPTKRRHNWSYWNPVWKKAPCDAPKRIGACVPRVVISGKDLTITVLTEMAGWCPEKARDKYARAIEFIRSNAIRIVTPGDPQASSEGSVE